MTHRDIKPENIEPALKIVGQQIAEDIGLWVLHVARTHPRLSDVLGWARIEASLNRGVGQSARAWGRFASWLEQLDPEHYPAQVASVLESIEANWRGMHAPPPSMKRADMISLRNAKPLPT